MSIRSLSLALLLALMLPLSAPAPARASDAAGVVTAYHDSLLTALAATAGKAVRDRFEALAPAMDRAFDFEAMVKTAAGTAWRQASPANQERLLAAFRRVSIATNADRFAPLGDARFETLGMRDGPRGLKLVDTRLEPMGAEPVALTYVVREKDGVWRIVDVLLQGGISELAVRASEYRRIAQDGGDAALTAALEKQAATLLSN